MDHGTAIAPRFRFRGMKGWWWTLDQYLAEIPFIAGSKLNFLMDCDGLIRLRSDEWWKPMKDARKKAYLRLIHACRENDITFCFAQQPHFVASHLLDEISGRSFDAFYQHFDWAQKQGVQWFSICLDGTSWGSAGPAAGGATHAAMVNAVFDRLRTEETEAQFIFCPVACWGDGTNPEHRAYLENLGRDLRPEVFVFWNGDGVVTHRITRVAAESYKKIVKHRLFLWDNYPVNDGSPTLHLGPVSGRDADLCEVIEGYLSNAMYPQSQINRLPLATCADYALNPAAYKPARSIGQSILRLGGTSGQQELLKRLVEAYPGFIVAGGGTGTNPVREKFANALARSAKLAQSVLRQAVAMCRSFAGLFPHQFTDARQMVANDIGWMKQQMRGP